MKKIYSLFSALICLLISIDCNAQESPKSSVQPATEVKVPPVTVSRAQNVFVEAGGQGLLFTANYDTRFGNRRDGFGGRVGIGYIGSDGENATTIPVSFNYLLGNSGKHFFEVGLGATVIAAKANGSFFFDDGSTERTSSLIGTMSFAYRLQPVSNGFSLRAGITPIFDSSFFMPYFGGLSLGYTF
ncbi:hypothetical protein GZH53_07560 [Flavihumibacter sp. R14]|nr:hypothetical protein [Flavihumibacter soli]